MLWTLLATASYLHLPSFAAISDVNDVRSIDFFVKLLPEDGEFRLTLRGGDECTKGRDKRTTSSNDNADGTRAIESLRSLRPGFEQMIMDVNCSRLVSIDTSLHLGTVRLASESQKKVRHKIVKNLSIDTHQLRVETVEGQGVSAIFSITPSTKDAEANWLAPIKRMKAPIPNDGFLSDSKRLSLDDLRSAVVEAFSSEYKYDILKTTQRMHVAPCNSSMIVTSEYRSDNSSTPKRHQAPEAISEATSTIARNGSVQITYDACAAPSGQFETGISLPMEPLHYSRSSSSVLTVLSAAVTIKDTRPYQVSCLSLSSSRTGHSVTKVGPYMVMFGGLAVLPGTHEAVPVSELWVFQQDNGDDSKGWLSLDRKHNIFIRPRARYGHVAAATSDGLFVIYGGHSGREYLHDVWAIRIGDNLIDDNPLQHDVTFPPFRWRQCYSSSTFPKASLMAASIVDESEQLFVFGGQQESGGLSNQMWRLDLSRLTPTEAGWAAVWPFEQIVPSARFGHSLVWLPSRPKRAVLRAGSVVDFAQEADAGGMLLFGGVEMGYADLALKNDLWFFDVAMRRWIPLQAAEADNPSNRPMSPNRPPPLAFHVAASLGSAMVVIASTVAPGGSEVRSDIWRWTDDDGWSLQFASQETDSSEAGFHSAFKRVVGGAMQYWPEVGKLLIYGGQSDAKAWQAWHFGVTKVQQERQTSNYVPVMQYFPPMFAEVSPDSMKSDVLFMELEACVSPKDASDALLSPPSYKMQKVCLPCSVGAITSDGRWPGSRAPWLAEDAPQCEPCGAGTINSGGQCRPCPAGFFGAFKGMDSWRMCWPCRADEFSAVVGSSRCKPCPKRRTFNDTDVSARAEAVLSDRGSIIGSAIDDEDKEAAEQNCPMFSESAQETLERESVHEMNEPHGQNSQAQHLFWQEIAIQVWAAVVSCSILLLLLVQSRRPRSVAIFMRQFDMRPITAAQVPSEAGGVILLCYVVTCSCMAVVCFAHHVLYNSQLQSMSVPAQEISTRVGQIEADLLITADLVGYTGPCIDGDFEEGPWDLDAAEKSRRLRQTSRAQFDYASQAQFAFDMGVDSIPINVKEEFSFDDDQHRIERLRELQVEAEPEAMHPFLRSPRQHAFPSLIDTNSFVLLEDASANRTTIRNANEFGRKLKGDPIVQCHRFVSMTAGGIAWNRDVAESEPRTFCERLSNRQCRVSFRCEKCSLAKETARVILDVSTGYVFTAAREIHWRVKTTWLQPMDSKGHTVNSTKKSYSSIESVVTSGDVNSCLRGPKPSLVRMTLVPTDYQDLLASTHIFGFVLQFIDAHRGSVADQRQFHENLAQLQSAVELHASRSFLKLVLSKKRTAFDFLTQMLGFLSGMSLIARVTLAVWHSMDSRLKDRSACFWTNPCVRCFSSMLCCCISEETDVEAMSHRKSQTGNCTSLPGKWTGASESEEYELVAQTTPRG